MTNMGNRIRELRQDHGMTMEELGKILGVGKSAIVKYEKGEVENLPRNTIQKMANIFGVSPSYIMCFDGWDEQKLSDEVDLIDRIQAKYGKDVVKIIEEYTSLNDDGKKNIQMLISDISSLQKYQK